MPEQPMTSTRRRRTMPTGAHLLQDPALNKGTAFTDSERDKLKLRGLLPPRILTQEQQVQKILENFHSKASDIEKYIFLISASVSSSGYSPPQPDMLPCLSSTILNTPPRAR